MASDSVVANDDHAPSPAPSFSSSRIRSVAAYGDARPTTLAIRREHDAASSRSALAALAGPRGVTLLRTSAPHAPVSVLHHASPSSARPVTCAAFAPAGSSLLACARGDGALVWDVAGRPDAPTLGRLDHRGGGSGSGVVADLRWRDERALLTARGDEVACWDLRARRRTRPRPESRWSFGDDNGGGGVVDLVSVTHRGAHEIAAMDASGVVRVLDDRRTSDGGGGSALSEFVAHPSAGVGVVALRSNDDDDGDDDGPREWMTWGCDADGRTSVKTWRCDATRRRGDRDRERHDADDYWDMSADAGRRRGVDRAVPSHGAPSSWRAAASFGPPYAACARTCPRPFARSVVAIGRERASDDAEWEATLVSLPDDLDGDGDAPRTVASFSASTAADADVLARFLGTARRDVGRPIAAELTLGASDQASFEDEERGGGGAELRLCCLTSTGYLMTYGIPEAFVSPDGTTTLSSSPTSSNRFPFRVVRRPPRKGSIDGAPSSETTTMFDDGTERRTVAKNANDDGRTNDDANDEKNDASSFLRLLSRSSSSLRPPPPPVPLLPPPLPQREYPSFHPALPSTATDSFAAGKINDDDPTELDRFENTTYRRRSSGVTPPKIEEENDDDDDDDDDDRHLSPHAISQQAYAAVARGVEGVERYDPDDPANATTAIGPDPNVAPPVGAPADAVGGEDGGQQLPRGLVATTRSTIDPAEYRRVPCPRLCGASFAKPGGDVDGGDAGTTLLVFHNGAVKQTWKRFSKQSEGGGNASGVGRRGASSSSSSLTNLLVLHQPRAETTLADAPDDDARRESSADRTYPRTLHDLVTMNKAAKNALFDVDDPDNDATGNDSSDDDASYDDDDATTSSSDEDDGGRLGVDEEEREDDDDDDNPKEEDADSLYDSYFSNTSNVLLPPPPEDDEDDETSDTTDERARRRSPLVDATDDRAFVSDLLAPTVAISKRRDVFLNRGQRPELAHGWRLGAWWLTDKGGVPDDDDDEEEEGPATRDRLRRVGVRPNWSSPPRVQPSPSPRATDGGGDPEWGWDYDAFPAPNTPSSDNIERKTSAPTTFSGSVDRNTGDEKQLRSILRNKSSPSLFGADKDDPPHRRRSAKQVSMLGNFSKLFAFGTPSATPPDQILDVTGMRRDSSVGSIPAPHSLHEVSNNTEQNRSSTSSSDHRQTRFPFPSKEPNAITAAPPTNSETSGPSLVLKQLQQTRKICSHNAKVCREVGQTDKANVWALLEQILENSNPNYSDGFDGWGGTGGNALGRELVANLLRYYEETGDVQMLATIVCVLNGGRDRRRSKSRSNSSNSSSCSDNVDGGDNVDDEGTEQSGSGLCSLLPNEARKHDSYIHSYAAILYGWGLLEKRTELLKHKAYSIPGAGGEQIIPFSDSPHATTATTTITTSQGGKSTKQECAVIPNSGVAPGLNFAPVCPRCFQYTKPGTNVCESCKDFAFRCSICTNAVRGLFMTCLTCTHGGHVEHMMAWFSNHSYCPTGCGCRCTFGTFSTSSPGGEETTDPTSSSSSSPPFPQKRVFPTTEVGGGGQSSTSAVHHLRVGFAPTYAELELIGSASTSSVPYGAYMRYNQQPLLSPSDFTSKTVGFAKQPRSVLPLVNTSY